MCSMQLRYLQTLNNISAEKNSTIVFPIPIDIISQESFGRFRNFRRLMNLIQIKTRVGPGEAQPPASGVLAGSGTRCDKVWCKV